MGTFETAPKKESLHNEQLDQLAHAYAEAADEEKTRALKLRVRPGSLWEEQTAGIEQGPAIELSPAEKEEVFNVMTGLRAAMHRADQHLEEAYARVEGAVIKQLEPYAKRVVKRRAGKGAFRSVEEEVETTRIGRALEQVKAQREYARKRLNYGIDNNFAVASLSVALGFPTGIVAAHHGLTQRQEMEKRHQQEERVESPKRASELDKRPYFREADARDIVEVIARKMEHPMTYKKLKEAEFVGGPSLTAWKNAAIDTLLKEYRFHRTSEGAGAISEITRDVNYRLQKKAEEWAATEPELAVQMAEDLDFSPFRMAEVLPAAHRDALVVKMIQRPGGMKEAVTDMVINPAHMEKVGWLAQILPAAEIVELHHRLQEILRDARLSREWVQERIAAGERDVGTGATGETLAEDLKRTDQMIVRIQRALAILQSHPSHR